MLYRKKYIDLFHEVIRDRKKRFIALYGENGVGKTTFLQKCMQFDVFGKESEYQYEEVCDETGLRSIQVHEGVRILILDCRESLSIEIIRSIIEQFSSDIKVVFTMEASISDRDVYVFSLPIIGMREYIEHEVGNINIAKILSGEIPVGEYNHFRDIYIKHGGYPEHLLGGEYILRDFDKKRSLMISQLFEKEIESFDVFLRSIAMGVGSPFKADQYAKLLNISRRKVNKYIDILKRAAVVEELSPWSQDETTETTRHTKLYFRDLGYMKAILGDVHSEGTLRQGALENLMYFELQRKLGESHSLYYYRKKSGSEITFIAVNSENTLITPILVTVRSTDVIPQVFKVFDEYYSGQVERYMLLNDNKTLVTTVGDRQLMILPHIAI